MRLNMDFLKDMIWDYLNLIIVYTKKPGKPPDFDDGIILRRGATIDTVCHSIHRTISAVFKYALVWGTSTKFSPQRVGLTHTLHHEDVIQIIKKS